MYEIYGNFPYYLLNTAMILKMWEKLIDFFISNWYYVLFTEFLRVFLEPGS